MTHIDLELGQRVVNLLNEALELDPDALHRLCEFRTPCNDALATHPTIQAGPIDGDPADRVGLIGILNGLVGTYPSGWGCVAAIYDTNDRDQIRRFVLIGDKGGEPDA